jgi:hypothetical protein
VRVEDDGAPPRAGSVVARAVGRDVKGRLSPVMYAAAIGLSFVDRWLSMVIYAGMALVWLVPDRRIERTVAAHRTE